MPGILLTIDQTGKQTTRDFDVPPPIEVLQEGVGGSIQLVPYFNRIEHDGKWHACVAFCNEDGKNQGLRYNEPATKLWQTTLHANGHPGLIGPDGLLIDFLVGSIIVLWGDQAFMDSL